MSIFLILSNDVIVQALPKIRPKITLYALSTFYETGLIISENWKIDIFR